MNKRRILYSFVFSLLVVSMQTGCNISKDNQDNQAINTGKFTADESKSYGMAVCNCLKDKNTNKKTLITNAQSCIESSAGKQFSSTREKTLLAAYKTPSNLGRALSNAAVDNCPELKSMKNKTEHTTSNQNDNKKDNYTPLTSKEKALLGKNICACLQKQSKNLSKSNFIDKSHQCIHYGILAMPIKKLKSFANMNKTEEKQFDRDLGSAIKAQCIDLIKKIME